MTLNRTQDLTWRTLEHFHGSGEELLLEALLRRGFLARRDAEGVWLGTGSHDSDAAVLELVPDLRIVRVESHPHRYCRIEVVEDQYRLRAVAHAIIALGEHHVGNREGRMTQVGLRWSAAREYDWSFYRSVRWGAKLAVCPARSLGQESVDDALDIGIALLVKAMPIAGLSTYWSCDGHGTGQARIRFCFPWDVAWGEAVISALPCRREHTRWTWNERRELEISPLNGYGDDSLALMLEEIQHLARLLLDDALAGRLRRVRHDTIANYGSGGPGPELTDFRSEAAERLSREFDSAHGSLRS